MKARKSSTRSSRNSTSSAAAVSSVYPILRNRPVAKFRYKGNHTKPVRRTVLLTEVNRDIITGYEIREGNECRTIEDQVIKSFSREEVQDLERFALATDGNW